MNSFIFVETRFKPRSRRISSNARCHVRLGAIVESERQIEHFFSLRQVAGCIAPLAMSSAAGWLPQVPVCQIAAENLNVMLIVYTEMAIFWI